MQIKKNLILLFLTISMVLSGCRNNITETSNTTMDTKDNSSTNQPDTTVTPSVTASKEESEGYLSLTVTKTVALDKFISEIYCYDLKKETMSKVGEVPYTSQYPLTAYDRAENCVYYTAADENGDDQLCLYDLSKGTKEKITDEFYALNYAIVRNHDLILIGCKLGDHNILPYLFDKKTKSVTSLSWDDDFFTWIGFYNPSCDRFLVSGYSYKENFEIRDKSLDRMETNYIYEVDVKKHTKTKIIEEARFIDGFIMNQNKLIYKSLGDHVDPCKSDTVKVYDFSTKKTKELENAKDFLYWEFIYLTEDGKTLYYIGDSNGDYALFKYDFDKDSSTEIYSTSGEQAINNVQFIK